MKNENHSKLKDLKEKFNITKSDLELVEEYIVGNQISRISFNINNYMNELLIEIQPDFRWNYINNIKDRLQRYLLYTKITGNCNVVFPKVAN
jgi:hypothetical protein